MSDAEKVTHSEPIVWYGVIGENPDHRVVIGVVRLFFKILGAILSSGTARVEGLRLLKQALGRVREEFLMHLEAEQGQGQ